MTISLTCSDTKWTFCCLYDASRISYLAPSSGQRCSQMAVSWVEVTILRPICPGISSAIWLPRFRSCSLWGWSGSWGRPLSTTWPMNSSFTALLFHTWGRRERAAAGSKTITDGGALVLLGLWLDSASRWPDMDQILRAAATSEPLFQTMRQRKIIFLTINGASYLHSDGLPGLLPVEDAAGLELWLQRVLLNGRPDLLPLAVDDHIRVGTCAATKSQTLHIPKEGWLVRWRISPLVRPSVCPSGCLTSRAVLILKPHGVVDVNVRHNLRVAEERTPTFDLWFVLRQRPETSRGKLSWEVPEDLEISLSLFLPLATLPVKYDGFCKPTRILCHTFVAKFEDASVYPKR